MVDRRGSEEEGWVDGRNGARSRHPFDLTSGAYVSDNRASPVFRITSSNDRREFFVRENSTRTGFPRSTIVARSSSSSSISSLSLSPRRDRTDGSIVGNGVSAVRGCSFLAKIMRRGVILRVQFFSMR